MKLWYSFLILVTGILLLAGVALFATFGTHPWLFYSTECFIVLLLLYLVWFYRRTLQPYDTLISGMELVRDLDLTTRLAPSGQHETDIIVRTFNDLLARLRTEHLSLEEQYTFLSLLIEASPMGVVQCDLDGNITSMNPAARSMMKPVISEAMQRLPLGSETTVRLSSEPGVYRISHLSFPDRGYQHPFYLIESLTSEVRLAEKAAYERVIRMIAHEVNNSVAGIISALDNAALRDRLLAMSAFVTRFAEVVKIPAPQLQLCDLSEEVEACRPFLENLCLNSNVRLDFHLTDDAIPVHLDPILFQQVLVNIVKNSVESISTAPDRPAPSSPTPGNPATSRPTPAPSLQGGEPSGLCPTTSSESPGIISITAQPLPSLQGGVGGGPAGGGSLTITDNGRGISSETAQHLFTPFFSTKPQGQGLGLLLIRDILTKHGCTFTLQTAPTDHLTRFTIKFP